MTAPDPPRPGRPRWHAGVEIAAAAAVLALAPREAPGTPGVWVLGGLLVVASIGLWVRGAGWADVGLGSRPGRGIRHAGDPGSGWHVLLGLGLGALAALAASFLVGPGLAALTGRSAASPALAAVAQNTFLLVLALVLAWAHALGAEMVFRGWLLDRLETVWPDGARPARQAPGPLVLAALAYGWYLGDGSAASVVGGALLGLGLGLLGRAGRPSLALPIATSGAFASVYLALIYAGVVG
jgi:hypothetical protein